MAQKVGNGLDLQGQRIINQGDPTAPQDSATKAYVDNIAAGLAWKQPVRAATTANITLSGAQTIDTVSVVAEDRVLVKNQTTGSANGIYVAKAGAWVRATDADSAAELNSATVYVTEGATNADKSFTQTADSITLGTTTLVFSQVGGGTTYTAGNGLTGSTTFSVQPNGTSIDVSASGVKIADAAAGNGLASASGVLSVNTGTGLTISGDNVTIDTTLTARKYTTTNASGISAGTPFTVTHGLGIKNVVCQVYIEATGEQVLTDVTLVDTNSLTVTFAAAQGTGVIRFVVVG